MTQCKQTATVLMVTWLQRSLRGHSGLGVAQGLNHEAIDLIPWYLALCASGPQVPGLLSQLGVLSVS